VAEQTGFLELAVKLGYPGFRLDVETRIELTGVTGLFGPSGSGKSTLLRVIAGLEPVSGGTVRVGGDTWLDTARGIDLPAHRRPVGYVFQDTRLFPHLSVAGNLDFALRRANGPARITRDEVVDVLDLGKLMDRWPASLSGGERQRVAIARTLLCRPAMLLLDEPLAAMDSARKREILPYLEALPGRFGIPALFVSHAAGEMARLADRIVVLEDGRVTASGTAAWILGREDPEVAALSFEPVTLLEAVVREHVPDLGLTRLDFDGQALTVPAIDGVSAGARVRLSVRAGDVVLATSEPRNLSVRNVLAGTVQESSDIAGSPFTTVTVDVAGIRLKARLTRHAVADLGLTPGKRVYALLKTATFDRGP